MSRQSQQRLTAVAMAVLYALMSAGGEGLHWLSHSLAPAQASHGAPDHATCGCGAAGCVFATRSADRLANRGVSAGKAAGEKPHDPSQCSLCQTLAKMKTAAAPVPPAAETITHRVWKDIASQDPFFASCLSAYEARGPPAHA